mmetsp:Transcript_85959/g.229360  ORF Transcript_85959/g.229360 Transcript_85959/m.229360 type:complete len:244 (-) Transcript_85959:1073-1804(-)
MGRLQRRVWNGRQLARWRGGGKLFLGRQLCHDGMDRDRVAPPGKATAGRGLRGRRRRPGHRDAGRGLHPALGRRAHRAGYRALLLRLCAVSGIHALGRRARRVGRAWHGRRTGVDPAGRPSRLKHWRGRSVSRVSGKTGRGVPLHHGLCLRRLLRPPPRRRRRAAAGAAARDGCGGAGRDDPRGARVRRGPRGVCRANSWSQFLGYGKGPGSSTHCRRDWFAFNKRLGHGHHTQPAGRHCGGQ